MNHPEKWTFDWFYKGRGMTIDETQKKLSSMLNKDKFLQELDGRAEVERPISRLRRDALATVADMIDCCRAWVPDACILGNVRAGDALAALNSLLRIADDREKLRSFAQAIMGSWPEGGIEGDDLQEIACRHGMLSPEMRHEPCGEWCNCNAVVDVDSGEWQRGVECYRRTALLMGEAE